jgi:aspartyl-tRNA(Asn)/glutamyl-tRNA(Gln) amidotransferase subunit B
MEWEVVIGLEVHTQLLTDSKIFSGASCAYGAQPNAHACGIDLAMPGTLPVLNEKVAELAIRFGLSIQAQIAKKSVFARKNYFYPDLPKGYQISQFDLPIVANGHIDIELADGTKKRIRIERAHLEEDAGKSLHEDIFGSTGVDFNRAGTPLLEIVSAPDLRSAAEAVAYLKSLHTLVRYLQVSDGNMQEGSFRCDVNISLRKKGAEKFGTRAEIKNINSFRYVEKAIQYEMERQKEILESGGTVVQETRLYDPDKDITRPMRSKEEANDYRYFPDPDLLPLVVTQEMIEEIRQKLPELPWEKRLRFEKDYDLSQYDANLLTSDIDTARYFETVLTHCQPASPKMAANWLNGDFAANLNRENLSIKEAPVNPSQLAQLLRRIADQTISNTMGKQVFEALWQGEGDVDAIIEKKGLKQISDTKELEQMIDRIIENNPEQVAQYLSGKDKLFGFFVGQAMKISQGKANPQQLNELLKEKLKLAATSDN